MKRPERYPPDDPREWLNRAKSNLRRARERIPDDVRQVGQLTKYAIVGRYPHEHRPVSEDDYMEALALAEIVVRWAEDAL